MTVVPVRSSWTLDAHGFVAEDGQPRRSGHRCTGCGHLGHNSRTCPALAAFRERTR